MKKIEVPHFEYDHELKVIYLAELEKQDYSVSQFNVACSFLKKISAYEATVKSPCYKYSREGILDLVAYFNSTSLATLKTLVSTLRNYIVFINDLENNPLRNVPIMSIESRDLEYLINKLSKNYKYITYKEYLSIINIKEAKGALDINWIDLAQITLLWHGIKGKSYKDLLDFSKTNFIEECCIFYKGAIIDLLPVEQDILKRAFRQETYFYYDKYTKQGFNREVQLNDNPYLLRSTASTRITSDIISESQLKYRLATFTNLKLKLPSLSGVSLFASGAVYRVLEKNNFQPLSVAELNKVVNKNGEVAVAYAKLKEIQDIILNKVKDEQANEKLYKRA